MITKLDILALVGCFAGGCLVLAVLLLIALIRDLLAKRRKRLDEWSGDAERATSEIGIITVEPVHVARSPMLDRRPTPRPTVQQRNDARIEQQARHANVVTAAGPFTQEFNARVEWETGKPPAGRGPREADVRRPAEDKAWQQLDLFAEVG